jgi:hypothetical protein
MERCCRYLRTFRPLHDPAHPLLIIFLVTASDIALALSEAAGPSGCHAVAPCQPFRGWETTSEEEGRKRNKAINNLSLNDWMPETGSRAIQRTAQLKLCVGRE